MAEAQHHGIPCLSSLCPRSLWERSCWEDQRQPPLLRGFLSARPAGTERLWPASGPVAQGSARPGELGVAWNAELKVVGRERCRNPVTNSLVGALHEVVFRCSSPLNQRCVREAAIPPFPASPASCVPVQAFLNPSSGPDEWSDLPAKYPGKQKRDYFTDRSLSRANSSPGHQQQLTSGSKGGAEGAGRTEPNYTSSNFWSRYSFKTTWLHMLMEINCTGVCPSVVLSC